MKSIFLWSLILLSAFTSLAAIPPDVEKLIQSDKYAEALTRVDMLLKDKPGDAELTKLRADIAAQVPATGTAAAAIPDAQLNRFNDLIAAGKQDDAAKMVDAFASFYPDDPRLPGLRSKLTAPIASAATVVAPVTTTSAAQPTGMDRVTYNATMLLVQDAQQAADPATRKATLQRFLTESEPLTTKYPGLLALWQARAAVAVELEDVRAGAAAASNLIKLGAVDSSDPALQQLMARLQLKGWLDPKKTEDLLAEEQRAKAQEEQRRIVEKTTAEADRVAKKALNSQFDPLVGDYYNLCAHWMLSKTEKKKLSLASGSVSIAKIGDAAYHISGDVNADGYPANKRADIWLRYHFDNNLEPLPEAVFQEWFPKAEDRSNVANAAYVSCDGTALQDINSGRSYRITKMMILKLKDGNILFYGTDSPDTQNPILKRAFGGMAGFEYHPNGER